MNKTYCGKSCEECSEKFYSRCNGCTAGIEKKSDNCEIALCCKREELQSCQDCSPRSCKIYHSIMTKNASSIAKWMSILFILCLLSNGVSLITAFIPSLKFLGNGVELVLSVSYGLVLLMLSSIYPYYYKIAGICYVVSDALSFILSCFSSENILIFILTVITLILGVVTTYNEIIGHSELSGKLDDALSSNWRRLWNLYKGMLFGFIAIIVLIFINPVLVAVITIAIIVIPILIGIFKIIYLYQTAKKYRAIS